ncbi:MAG: histidine kinase dimerization/phospho-acceptor domain-containing protein [Verrucomicrobiota bacterium]|nr:histidine kinase dimerization/phospho-acceptor domain-containing protein [Verrucomicrobiota bacterium]
MFAKQNGLDPALAGIGVNYFDVCIRVTGEPLAQMVQGIRAVIAGEQKEFELEYPCHSPTDKQWFLCRVTQFTSIGPVRVVVAHENITQMKVIARQQLRAQRMESLGTLAGGIAHDLNNALAPIMMGVELLRGQNSGQSHILDILETSAQQGADMVRQLLTFAKGAEGERVPLKLERLVDELLPDIPIVVASGRMEEHEQAHRKNLNVITYLHKPFTEGQLAEVLKTIFAPK